MITCENITKSFGRLQVLRGITLEVADGEFAAIVGASGAGKTTLLQVLSSLDKPDTGTVLIDGSDIYRMSPDRLADFRNRRIGFVFQFHQLLPEFTALENVALPAYIAGTDKKKADARARELLEYMGMADRLGHKPSELSGGEKQRAGVARALINNPSIIFADEPTGSLDSRNKEEIKNLLLRLNSDFHLTTLMVTHDKELAEAAERVIEIKDGVIEEVRG